MMRNRERKTEFEELLPRCPKEPPQKSRFDDIRNQKGILLIIGILISGIAFATVGDIVPSGDNQNNQMIPIIEWEKNLANEFEDGDVQFVKTMITSDNNILSVTWDNPPDCEKNCRLSFNKFDLEGNLLWTKVWPFYTDKVFETKDSGFILGIPGDSSLRIIRTDSRANIVWERNIFERESEGQNDNKACQGKDIIVTDNNEIIAAGFCNSITNNKNGWNSNFTDLMIFKLNFEGKMLLNSTKILSQNIAYELWHIDLILYDGKASGYYIYTANNSNFQTNSWTHQDFLYRIDKDFSNIWKIETKSYGIQIKEDKPIIGTVDDGLIIISESPKLNKNWNQHSRGIDIIKVNLQGEIIQHKEIINYPLHSYVDSFLQTSDKGIILGYNPTESGTCKISNLFLLKYDLNLTSKWNKSTELQNTEFRGRILPSQIFEVSPEKFLVMGSRNIKFKSDCNSDNLFQGEFSQESILSDFSMLMIDNEGEILWEEKKFGNNLKLIKDIKSLSENETILTGVVVEGNVVWGRPQFRGQKIWIAKVRIEPLKQSEKLISVFYTLLPFSIILGILIIILFAKSRMKRLTWLNSEN
jgi:hypothetical protein